MNYDDGSISAELMARFANSARRDFKQCVEHYCTVVNGSYHVAVVAEARDALNKARWIMDLRRTAEYW